MCSTWFCNGCWDIREEEGVEDDGFGGSQLPKRGSNQDGRVEGSDGPLGSDAFEEFREINRSRPQGTMRTPINLAKKLKDVLRGVKDELLDEEAREGVAVRSIGAPT